MKIIAVNIAFRTESFYKRWRMLAQESNLDIVLIGPKHYVYKHFGEPITFKPEEIYETNFKVMHIDMATKKYLRHDWWSWKYINILLKEKPDIVYLIGLETRNIVFATYIYKKLLNPNMKIGLFSMRGTNLPLYGKEFRWRWERASTLFDFINVHYPRGKEIFKVQGSYKGPIQLQTQIGVDKDIFYQNIQHRRSIREMYNILPNECVFGSAIRIEEKKGIFDIIKACTLVNLPLKFLILGDGKDFQKAKDMIKSLNLNNKIILSGFVENGSQVAAHLNAMDCFVHIPHTTKDWVDTFPLAVVQAMATKLPIIGSNSGAIPYQLGEFGIIIPEKDPEALAQVMRNVIQNPDKIKKKGNELYERVINSFEIRHLNKCLYQTFQAVYNEAPSSIISDQVFAFKKWFQNE